MSGIMNKLGLGHHDNNNTHDVAREAGHNHTAAASDANNGTTTTTTTTTNNSLMNNSSNLNASNLPGNSSSWNSSNTSNSLNSTNSSLGNSSLNNSTWNNSSVGNSSLSGSSLAAPYGSATNASSTRTGAAYSGQSHMNQGLVSQSGMNQGMVNQQNLTNQRNGLTGDNAMTRSEEQLRVEKASVPSGVAALDKTVSVEHVEKAIPVQRERVVIEREPITCENLPKAMSGPTISEGHVETVLREDRVAATKETVPVERIRLAKQVETSTESVGADLKKEHIDLTMHDNSKTDLRGSNYGSSLTNDKIDSRTSGTSGLTNESLNTRDSRIANTTSTRNV